MQLLVGLYALVCFGFFTFFLPVMTGWMNQTIFLAGAGLTVLVVLRVVHLIYWRNPARTHREAVLAGAPAMALIGLLVGLLFYELDSARAVLIEVRRDVPRGETIGRPLRTGI